MATAKPKVPSGRGRGRPRKDGQVHVFKSVKPAKHHSLRSGGEYAQRFVSSEVEAGTKVGAVLVEDVPKRGRGRPKKNIDENKETEQVGHSNTVATVDHKFIKDDGIADGNTLRSPPLAATPKRGRGRPRKSSNVQVFRSPEVRVTRISQTPATALADEDEKPEKPEVAVSPVAGSKRKRGRPRKSNDVNRDGHQRNEVSISDLTSEAKESAINVMSPPKFTAINGVNQQFDTSAEVPKDDGSDDPADGEDGQKVSNHRIMGAGHVRFAQGTPSSTSSPSLGASLRMKKGRGRPSKKPKTTFDGAGSLSAVPSSDDRILSQLTDSSDDEFSELERELNDDLSQKNDSTSDALKGGLTQALTEISRKILQHGRSHATTLIGRNGSDLSEKEVQHVSHKERVKTFADGLKNSDASRSPPDMEGDPNRVNDTMVLHQPLPVIPDSKVRNANEKVYNAPTAVMGHKKLSNNSAAQLSYKSIVQNDLAPDTDSGHIPDLVRSELSSPAQVYTPFYGRLPSLAPVVPANQEDGKILPSALKNSAARSQKSASASSRGGEASEDNTNELVDAESAKRYAVLEAADRLAR